MLKDRTDSVASGIEPRSGWPHELIRAELNRILSHPEFQATERMCDFLRFVVEETLEGRENQLKGYTIATQVFGRNADFDAALDPVVRIQAGRLRRALERYYLVAGGSDPIQIEIPKGQYAPLFIANHDASPEMPIGDPLEPPPSAATPGPRIALLPPDLVGEGQDQDHFSVGLAEELATELGRFQDIAVIPCQRAPLGSLSPSSIEEICQTTGARFLLRGTIRRDSQTMKVSMHLLDTSNQSEIWAESYKYDLDVGRFIAMQEEIARNVVSAIASEYGIIARRLSAESRKKVPAEFDSYEAMLCYYSYQIAPSPEAMGTCFTALERAIQREPEYGPAWSALATLHCQLHTFDFPGYDDALATALHHARMGVTLEPGSQIGRLILAYASYLAEDFDVFHEEIGISLALNPNSPYATGAAGYFYAFTGDFERGIALLDKAIRANPYHPKWFHQGYFMNYFRLGMYAEALQELERYQPTEGYWLHVLYTTVLGKLGQNLEAETQIEALLELKPDFGSRARELLRRSLKSMPSSTSWWTDCDWPACRWIRQGPRTTRSPMAREYHLDTFPTLAVIHEGIQIGGLEARWALRRCRRT